MTRTTYVLKDGKLVLKAFGFEQLSQAPVVMGDIQPFRTIDGVEITSRSHLRAYEQRTGTRQVGNDFNSYFGLKPSR